MIFGLDVSHSGVEKNISFAKRDIGRRQQVLCQKTIEFILQEDLEGSKLVIPGSITGCDYCFKRFIEFIRIDINKPLAMIPIVVFFENEDEYLELFCESKDFQELRYNKIAVTFTVDPQDNNCLTEIDDFVLRNYLSNVGQKPSLSGSHDKSNRWGPYVVMSSLCVAKKANKGFLNATKELRDDLIEETYYKRVIQSIQDVPINNKLGSSLWSEQLRLDENFPSGKVLVIEDQLDDGWQDAYKAIFSISKKIDLLFAEDEKSAEEIVESTRDLDLILLDVRLDKNKDKKVQNIEDLSGVKLAVKIRDKYPTLPIIVVTASNKSWTLSELLDIGIDSYWVKGSPDFVNTVDLGIKNVLDLFKKINETMQWSRRTRKWQKELYRIAETVRQHALNTSLPGRLDKKAKSLHALLFRSFSPFSSALSEGLQMNLAFLEIYSCMNDLTEWVCKVIPGANGSEQWFLLGDDTGQPLVESKLVPAKNGKLELRWFLKNQRDSDSSWDFPDKGASKQIVIYKQRDFKNQRLDFYEFKRLAKIRNGLPLIHGKIISTGTSSKSIERVEDKDIDSLVALMAEIVDHHVGVLKR